MLDELDRANDIITEFLSLAKNRHTERSNQKLNDIIESIWPLMEADAVSQGKSIITELSEDLPWTCLDDKEIRQLILNLVRNGLEAIEPGKRVYIRTYVEENKVVLAVHGEGKGYRQIFSPIWECHSIRQRKMEPVLDFRYATG